MKRQAEIAVGVLAVNADDSVVCRVAGVAATFTVRALGTVEYGPALTALTVEADEGEVFVTNYSIPTRPLAAVAVRAADRAPIGGPPCGRWGGEERRPWAEALSLIVGAAQ